MSRYDQSPIFLEVEMLLIPIEDIEVIEDQQHITGVTIEVLVSVNLECGPVTAAP